MTDPNSDPNPYRDTGKTCLGGGMHCPSASSFSSVVPIVILFPCFNGYFILHYYYYGVGLQHLCE